MASIRAGHRSPHAILSTLTAIVAILFFGTGCSSTPTPAQPPSISTTSIPSAPTPPDFSKFTGHWIGHGNAMTVKADGTFTMSERTYMPCDQNPPPCDSDTNGQINDGAIATGALQSVSGTVATGAINTTNDGSALPTGPVTFTLDATNDAINALNLNWCGPNAPEGVCY